MLDSITFLLFYYIFFKCKVQQLILREIMKKFQIKPDFFIFIYRQWQFSLFYMDQIFLTKTSNYPQKFT